MIEWLDDFYSDPDMRSTVLRNFLPLFTNYVTEAMGAPVPDLFVQSLAESYVDRYLGSSRAQLQEVVKYANDPLAALSQRFDEWEEKRPGKVAANELIRSANAAQVEKFRETGVTKMVWRASGGKTCPFCTELDGTIISVDGTFFEAGDELNPEGATAPIHFESSLGHPPVHQGCVCSVEAVEGSEVVRTEGDFKHPEAVDSALDDFNSTWTDAQEQSVVLDPKTGEVRWRGTGEVTSVDMSGLSDDVWKDSVMVHTHPFDGSFSAQDLGLMIEKDIAEMRVTGPNQIFVIKRPEGGWGDASRPGVNEHWNQNFQAGAQLPKEEMAQLMGGDSWALNVNNYAVQTTADTYGWDYRVLDR